MSKIKKQMLFYLLSKRIIKSLRFCSFQFEWFATLLIGKKDLCCLETKLVFLGKSYSNKYGIFELEMHAMKDLGDNV